MTTDLLPGLRRALLDALRSENPDDAEALRCSALMDLFDAADSLRDARCFVMSSLLSHEIDSGSDSGFDREAGVLALRMSVRHLPVWVEFTPLPGSRVWDDVSEGVGGLRTRDLAGHIVLRYGDVLIHRLGGLMMPRGGGRIDLLSFCDVDVAGARGIHCTGQVRIDEPHMLHPEDDEPAFLCWLLRMAAYFSDPNIGIRISALGGGDLHARS